jgi:hypothetical protein
LKLIENLHKDCDKSSKTAEDLRVNNADLAKTLSSKEQKIQELERALANRRESSEKEISEIRNKLELLFKEYEKALKHFGVHPAPFPANTGISNFMKWIDTKFKALPGVISGASDFSAAFSVESILKLLHDFHCADLVKFREKLSQFPDAKALQDFVPMKMSWILKPNSRKNSGSPVGRKLPRTSLVLAKTVATAVAATVILEKTLDAKNLLRRWISLVEIVEKLSH